jgi:hypothetical protein
MNESAHPRSVYSSGMAELRETLLEIERALGGGTGDTYREHLIDDAVVVVPGAAITREQCAYAIDAMADFSSHSRSATR